MPGGALVEVGTERLDRLDAAGPAGRLDGGGEGHADADEQRQDGRRRAAAPGARRRPTRPSPSTDTMAVASTSPSASPRTDPSDAEDERLANMNDMTWRRLAPAARSRPTSRMRSATVIDSVLKIRNAPANRAIAAMSAIVTAKSVVEARSVAAMSAGVDRTYGCAVRPPSSARSDAGDRGALGEADVDARDARAAEDGLRGLQRDDDRPPGCVVGRAVAGDDADDAVRDACRRRPSMRDRRADGEAVLGRETLADERGRRQRDRRARRPRRARSACSRGSRTGSMPRTVTGGGSAAVRSRVERRREVGPALERRAPRPRHRACAAIVATVVSGQAVLAERGDAQVGTGRRARDRARGPTRRCRRSWPSRRTGRRPRGRPRARSGSRAADGRAGCGRRGDRATSGRPPTGRAWRGGRSAASRRAIRGGRARWSRGSVPSPMTWTRSA